MVLRVERPQWNRVELAAATYGLDWSMSPEGDIEVSGSLQKLQQMLNACKSGPRLLAVVPQKEVSDD